LNEANGGELCRRPQFKSNVHRGLPPMLTKGRLTRILLCVDMALAYRGAVNSAHCAIKTNLLHSWDAATNDYERALSLFSEKIGTKMSPEEYDELHLAIKKAREWTQQARRHFQEHIEQHHCTFDGRGGSPLNFH